MRIAIVGASSQVGASVAHYLASMDGVDITCITRSALSELYFDLLRIPTKRIELGATSASTRVLAEFDAVADFSYPAGQVHSLPQAISANIAAVTAAMRPGATYLYMSSIMAFGMNPGDDFVRERRLSRTSYARLKRVAEREAVRHGAAGGVSVFNLRLGQVHGFLQSVSISFRDALARGTSFRVRGEPGDLTNTIFPSAIAEAIVKCARHTVTEGTHVLVSSPQWTLQELYGFYREFFALRGNVEFEPLDARGGRFGRGFLDNARGMAASMRGPLEAHVLMRWPAAASRLKGLYRVAGVSRKRRSAATTGTSHHNVLGRPPGILPTESSSLAAVMAAERQFFDVYEQALRAARK